MSEPLAYLNGRFLPASQLSVPVYDAGFVQGVTVAEQMRTFRGRLFRLEEHLARLARSLSVIGIDPKHSPRQLTEIAGQLVAHNHGLLHADDDLGLSLFATPGPYAGFAPPDVAGPTVAMHTYPIAFGGFAAKYETGESLAISTVRQVPGECWPTEVKCRSRMHYYLADREARAKHPGARALLLDLQGRVCEASTANVVAYFAGEGIVSPRAETILPGITLGVLAELAAKLKLPWIERDLLPAELPAAAEILLCSTSPCLLPVTALDGRPLGPGQPGPVFRELLEAFGKLVQLDIADQARRFAERA